MTNIAILPDDIMEQLAAPFELWQHEYRKQTRGQYPNQEVTGYLTYVGIEHAIGRMNKVLGAFWSWEIIRTDVHALGEKIAVITVGRIIYRDNLGTEFFRSGQGAAQFTSQADDLDKVVKSAQAEAFKKATHQFGVGAYLWDKGLADHIALELLRSECRSWEAKARPKKPANPDFARRILGEIRDGPQESSPAAVTGPTPPASPGEARATPTAGDEAHPSEAWKAANSAMRGAVNDLMVQVHQQFPKVGKDVVILEVEPILQSLYDQQVKGTTSATQLTASHLQSIGTTLRKGGATTNWFKEQLTLRLSKRQHEAA